MSRSLWPREHGAYAQLGVPLATALALATPSTASVLFAIAACCAFLANEPLLVVLGHRGARLREQQAPRARRRLVVLAAAAAIAGAAGCLLASQPALVACGAVAVPVLALVVIAWRRAVHSLWGEIVAAIALPGAGLPVAVASGVPLVIAGELWLAWSLGYAASVVAVHDVIDNRRGRTRMTTFHAALLAALTLGLGAAVVVHPLLAVGLPLAALATGVALVSPSPRRLRTIGVVLVVASVVAAIVGIATVRT